jgi:hypothetical protein
LPYQKERSGWNFNHDFLQENDRAEIIAAWNWFRAYYPVRPTFRDFLPAGGQLPAYLRVYFDSFIGYASAIHKRPAFCEVYSRGRAGALRTAYGGYHIAQIRDPISQFGSFYRALEDGGLWMFLCDPVVEIGVNGNEPLFTLIPDAWHIPKYAWPAGRPADVWLAYTNYKLLVASSQPRALELAFRTHMLSWLLTNLVAMCFSDLILDFDRLNDDRVYRDKIVKILESETGSTPDLRGLTKFSRYFQFEAVDLSRVCNELEGLIVTTLADGRLETAIRGLGQVEPVVAVRPAAEMILAKMNDSIKAQSANSTKRFISNDMWRETASAHRIIWQNGYLKQFVRLIYPAAAPLVRMLRKGVAWI